MSYYSVILLLLHAVTAIAADWIKLPSISPTTPAVPAIFASHSHDVPKVVFKLAPAPDPDVLSSETMSSVFSYRPTTESTMLPPPSTKKSYIRKYFQTTVTSKLINFPGNVSDLMNRNEFMEPVVLLQKQQQQQQQAQAGKRKTSSGVSFYNKTVAMNVIPLKANQLIVKDEMTNHHAAEENDNDNDDEEEDDGVTVSDEESGSVGEDESYEGDDEYYLNDDDDDGLGLSKFTVQTQRHKPSSTASATTEMPKSHKKSREKSHNAQRRMQLLRKSPKRAPFPDINFPTFISFIKRIQESFALRTAKSIGEKIKMLMSFRDRMMLAINQQIKRLWVKQPRVTKTKKRGKRTLGGGGGGGGGWMEHGGTSNAMDFPSAEGALLSICFLTFAVFLIKLVLQVIQTIKMKKAMWASQVMMGGTDNVVIKRRNERDIRYDEEYYALARTLDSIHNLKVH